MPIRTPIPRLKYKRNLVKAINVLSLGILSLGDVPSASSIQKDVHRKLTTMTTRNDNVAKRTLVDEILFTCFVGALCLFVPLRNSCVELFEVFDHYGGIVH